MSKNDLLFLYWLSISILSEATLRDVLAGVLLGTAVGDALGLPAENLSSRRIRRWWKGEWRMRFVFGRGMVSDDTEHTLMVAQALLTRKMRISFSAVWAGSFVGGSQLCRLVSV